MRIVFYVFSLAAIITSATPSWCEEAKLTGYVRDKRNNSPINGADVMIAATKRTATTNSDGRYVVTGLPRGQKVRAVYRKGGYEAKPQDVVLSAEENTVTVELRRDIDDAAYWTDVFKSVKQKAESSGGGPEIYAQEWKDVEDSTLSPETKAMAARQLLGIMSPVRPSETPETLTAYGKIDALQIYAAQAEFHKAIEVDGHLRLNDATDPKGTVRLHPKVAADIAAKQIEDAPAVSKKTGTFLTDFEHIYGKEAAADVRERVAKSPREIM